MTNDDIIDDDDMMMVDNVAGGIPATTDDCLRRWDSAVRLRIMAVQVTVVVMVEGGGG
ncbi:hypothetical protein HanHA300_Chr11g0384641 [Helianthus annuus]|nr:hypothetical protein HanHA300_Chr11g0384641 [Helianthus annuus]KAJ0683811.1 hypothetical protein HanLR1_Chr11g0384391 [Helianthus annuus]